VRPAGCLFDEFANTAAEVDPPTNELMTVTHE
jgi:hypothetical protein